MNESGDIGLPVNEFNRYADFYDQFAKVQYIAADDLAMIIEGYKPRLPNSSILELGCGTGLLTEWLLKKLPDSNIFATDISAGMLDVIHQKMGRYTQIQTRLLDANNVEESFRDVGCLVSGMTLQWLSDPVKSIHQWMETIHPEGFAFISWLGDGSFPEWKAMAKEIGVAYTGNTLPGTEIEEQIRMKAQLDVIDYQVQHKMVAFDSALSFFKSIRNIGASTEINPHHGKRNVLRLCKHWDKESPKGVLVDHELHYLVIRKKSYVKK